MSKCPIDPEGIREAKDCDCVYYYIEETGLDGYGNEVQIGYCTHPELIFTDKKDVK